MTSSQGMCDFLMQAMRLKRVPRTGWLDRGIPSGDVESVADHSWFVGLAAWALALDDPALDADLVLRLAIIHDLAEALTGDIPPYAPEEIPDPADEAAFTAFFARRQLASPERADAKRAAAQDAMTALLASLPETVRQVFRETWDIYERRASPEARFVKDLDRLDAFMQARHYAAQYPDRPVAGFTEMARDAIVAPAVRAVRDELLTREG